MPIIRQSETRRTETPDAVMTTLASPTLGGSSQLLWRVEMTADNRGPMHSCDTEQIWTILTGRASFDLDGTPRGHRRRYRHPARRSHPTDIRGTAGLHRPGRCRRAHPGQR
ncbi:hypothetical protein [Nocardia paucivorans]|uniref:hypothetical protein n=1 Tax=Nocardia paucivorans TaxID=114259 RepID=UPI0003030018|nr:hypothetical protein [Nocardia paucivorans]